MIHDFIKKVAKDNNLTYSETKEIFESQFKFARECFHNKESVRIPQFGSFIMLPHMQERFERLQKNGKDKKTTED